MGGRARGSEGSAKTCKQTRVSLTDCRYLELTNLREIKSGESLSELLEVDANGGWQLKES